MISYCMKCVVSLIKEQHLVHSRIWQRVHANTWIQYVLENICPATPSNEIKNQKRSINAWMSNIGGCHT